MSRNPSRVPWYSDLMLVLCGDEVGWCVSLLDFTGRRTPLIMDDCSCCLIGCSGELAWLVECKGFPDMDMYEVAIFEAMSSTFSIDACVVLSWSVL